MTNSINNFKYKLIKNFLTKDEIKLLTDYCRIRHRVNIDSFDFKQNEIRVCNDGGRLTRPVLRVKDGKAIITKDIIDKISKKELSWNDLLTSCK